MMRAETGTSRFNYRIFGGDGAPVATLRYPDMLAVARNGWARDILPEGLSGASRIELLERTLTIEFERTSERAVLADDLLFLVMDGGAVLASAAVKPGRRAPLLLEIGERRLELRNRNRFLGLRWVLEEQGRTLGEVREATGFSVWRRRFELDLRADLEPWFQIFILFLALNGTYG
jgi:hypothetical protein